LDHLLKSKIKVDKMSDKEYIKWKKKHGGDELPLWIIKIIEEDDPSDEFCMQVYNNKDKEK
jgi:hypothetical protein